MGAGGSSRGKVIDPSEHPQFTPKYTAPFYMALDIECAEFFVRNDVLTHQPVG